MFNNLRGKKLLILGGMQRTCVIVKRAQELGIYVIVTDYDPTSPARKIADESLMIDALDTEKLIDYCKKNNVDGVMTAYADILLQACVDVAKGANIPYYMTDEMLKMALDKEEFKKQCNKYNVPVPKTFSLEKKNDIQYPVFIKPLDASGSRGASLCKSENDLNNALDYAYSFSKGKKVTVEQFLTGTEFILDYIIVDGNPMLQSMADRYITSERSKAVNSPDLMIFPSKNINQYLNEVDPKVKNMFRQLKFDNGLIFLQGYADKQIAFYEMGCRLGGTWPYIDEHFNGINPMDMLFNHAITGKMVNEPITLNPKFKGFAANIYFVSKKENVRLKKIKGLKEIDEMNSVVCTIQYHFEDDILSKGTLTDILLFAVHLVADSFDELKQEIKKVYSLVDFYDENGESVLYSRYDPDLLIGYDE